MLPKQMKAKKKEKKCIIFVHHHKLPYIYIFIFYGTYLNIIIYCDNLLYVVTHCTLSWGGAWVNYGKLATKLGRFSNQLPLSPSSTPHFKSLAEIILFGMFSSLVFWIELSESPNLVPDSSMKPENGREMDWKGNEKTPQVELKPPWDDEKWDFAVKDL